jgi:hypothetical protein
VGIDSRMAHRSREAIGGLGCQVMFTAFGRGMDLRQGQPRFVCEIAFEQPMCANHLQREALAFACEIELGTARYEQPLRLHAGHQRKSDMVGHTERARKRGEGSMSTSVFQVEQMLQPIFQTLTITPGPTLQRPSIGQEKQESRRNGNEEDRENLAHFEDS